MYRFIKFFIFFVYFTSCLDDFSEDSIIVSSGETYYLQKVSKSQPFKYASFYDSGKVKIRCSVENGSLEGEFQIYHLNGTISTGIFNKGKVEGELIGYDSLDNVILKEEYKDGVRYGYTRSYSQKGDVQLEAYYLKDSLFYAKSYIDRSEFITPILTVANDSLFVGDTLILQYRLPLYNKLSKDKKLCLFFGLGPTGPISNNEVSVDSVFFESSESKQIGLLVTKEGEQYIHGFIGARGDDYVDYNTFRKRIEVFSR